MRQNYRQEIDSLRALAVIGVIIFHYFPKLLPGGYLGVDLFFVISGYVISFQIYKNLNNKNFNLKIFYIKRIKRILPPTFFVLLICSFVSFYLFTISDLIQYSKSLFFSLSFTSNIFFWMTGGYFTTSDELKPLLHLWSLSVEEQFYIFFPIVFLFLVKLFKNYNSLFFVVFFITLISYLLNYYIIQLGGSNPAFFLLPTRIWNFGFGILAMIYYVNNSKQTHSSLVLFIISILIVLGFFIEIKGLPRGSLIIFSTAILLSKKFQLDSLINKLYLNRYIRKVGLISFSLYLWHWPVLVYFKYYLIDEVSLLIKLFSFLIVIIMSIISYYFIETKFRYIYSVRKTIYSLSLVGFFLIVLNTSNFNKTSIKNDNIYSADLISMATQTNFRCNPTNFKFYSNSRSCFLNNPNLKYDFALVGNSHAQMYGNSIIENIKDTSRNGLLIPMTGCLPTIDLNISKGCIEIAKRNFNTYMNDPDIKTVIIGTSWQYKKLYYKNKIINDENYLIFGKSLLNLINDIKKKNKIVYLIGPLQNPDYYLPSVLSRKIKFGHISNSEVEKELNINRKIYNDEFNKVKKLLSSEMGAFFLDPSLKQCDNDFCYLGDKKGVYFADLDHLSFYGGIYLSDIFKNIFQD